MTTTSDRLLTLMSRGRLDWILVISGPLLIVGVLFLWSWFHRRAGGAW